MGQIVQDVRYSLRMLLKDPAFTAAAVVTLALGIGLNATTFSAVHGILLKPLPGVRAPEDLVQLYRVWGGIEYGSNSIPHYQDIRDRTGDTFDDVAAWTFAPLALSADGRTERTIGMMVSANFFRTFGAPPSLGRGFIPGEEDRDPGSHPVAILGHGFWSSRFGADPSVLGRTLSLNGHTFEIVGVAPPDFKGPASWARVPLYVPLMMQRELQPGQELIESRGNNSFNVVARLRDGVGVDRAQEAMDALLLQLREEHPDHYATQLGTRLVRVPDAGIHPTMAGASNGMSAVMMAVVGLLLLIACVNVANLFLARARDRRKEIGLRLSLGASRGRIVQQLLTESLVFALVAGLAALAMAYFATRALGGFRPPLDGPFAFDVELDPTVLLFTLAISLAAGLIFGMAPALQAARPDTLSSVKGDDDGRRRSRASSGLVVFQMALSILLLISSGLFLRSLQRATRIDPGFEDPSSMVVASLDPGLQGYDAQEAQALLDRIGQEVSAVPEVTGFGLTSWLPLGLNNSDRGVSVPGYEFSEGERRSISYAYVGEGYLEAMGVALVEGRTFQSTDDADGAPVIVVNERFADRFWPGESAVGKVVETAGAEREVVGVVETGKYQSLGEAPREFLFLPRRQASVTMATMVARSPAEPGTVLRRIREIVREADPDMPLYDVRTMEDHMGMALLPARLGGGVLGLFGLLGMVLAAVGMYGVMAYSVSQRKRELGIRVALGAEGRDVTRMVVGEGLRLTLVGTVLGLVGAAGASQLVQGLLYDVPAIDPYAFTLVPLILIGVALVAVYIPARRAALTDPMGALKSE